MGKVIGLVLAVILLAGTSQGLVGEPAMLLETDDLEFPEVHASWFDPSTIPSRIQELDGTRVVVYGAMFPPPAEKMRHFLLIGDTRRKPAQSYDSTQLRYAKIGVKLTDEIGYEEGKTLRVEGTLRIRPFLDRGELRFLYLIEDAKAEVTEPRPNRYERVDFFSC